MQADELSSPGIVKPRSSSAPYEGGSTGSDTSRLRRVLEGTGLVSVWTALGFLLNVEGDSFTYLLLGVPLTLAFQLLVRRRPLRELWVRDGMSSALEGRGVVLAAALMVAPGFYAFRGLAAGNWGEAIPYLVAMVGAVAAAYALRETTLVKTFRSALPSMAVGALVVTAVVGVARVLSDAPLRPFEMGATVLVNIALIFPVGFVLEEVAFRGALDAHAHNPGEPRSWLTAIFTSGLWGLWHLPTDDTGLSLMAVIPFLLLVHCAIGVPLTFAWRRTGNLSGPALGHAFVDALRNGLSVGL